MNTFVELYAASIGAIALAFVRLAPVMLLPVLSPMARVPFSIRVVLTLVVAVAASQLYGASPATQGADFSTLVRLAPAQLLLGLALAFGYQATMSAIMTIGRALDLQMGFGAAGVLDPATQNSESLIGTMMMWLVFVLTIETGLHYELLGALLFSFQVYPLDAMLPAYDPQILLFLLAEQFSLALLLALPVIIALFLFDAALGLTAKTMPQMNVYFVMLPLKMFVSILALSMTMVTVGVGIEQMFGVLREYWLGLLAR
ncbi:MAG: flagellar biosynthetic protein FliR [Pseudomonadota bacterium]